MESGLLVDLPGLRLHRGEPCQARYPRNRQVSLLFRPSGNGLLMWLTETVTARAMGCGIMGL